MVARSARHFQPLEETTRGVAWTEHGSAHAAATPAAGSKL
jgi:hypothetical protein